MRIVRDLLPDRWVIRDYRPDYGIDLLIELFEYIDPEHTQAATLGETLFVQVKSTEVVDAARLRVYPRENVELGPLQEDRAEQTEIDVARLQMETSELLTVQAIGSAIPVLLFLVELSTRRIFFVCLNDYIDKIIIPQDPAYHDRQSKVLHIPLHNCITAGNTRSLRPLETYGKRAKLYAAFEKFAYQRHELGFAHDAWGAAGSDGARETAARRLMRLVRHFLSMDLRYDFWTRIPAWEPIRMSHAELWVLQRLLANADPDQDLALLQDFLVNQPAYPLVKDYVADVDLPRAHWHFYTHLLQVWDRLATLARMYEEVVREWFLPTFLGSALGGGLRVAPAQDAE